MGGSGSQVWGGGHAGLGVPVGEASDGATLERVTAPRLCAARARETPVARGPSGTRHGQGTGGAKKAL